jgi:hypothetical protein
MSTSPFDRSRVSTDQLPVSGGGQGHQGPGDYMVAGWNPG